MAINLSGILHAEDVVLDLDVSGKPDVFTEAGKIFQKSYGISADLVTENLLVREEVGSTGLGFGVAVPHGRIEGLEFPAAAFLRLKTPVDFDSPDKKPVSILFVLLIPQDVTQAHLEILSEIASLFSDEGCRKFLNSEPDPAKIHRLICTWQPGMPLRS